MSTTITVTGNLADDPTLRYTKSGKAVANLRVLENYGRTNRDTGEWVEADEPNAYSLTVWGKPAENVAESLHKGDAIIATGTITTEAYEADGTKRTRQVITADTIGAGLTYATATITRNPHKSDHD